MLSIRTQDRMALVPYNEVICITRHNKNAIDMIMSKDKDIKADMVYMVWIGGNGKLGTYKSKERALEVLDEIENAYRDRTVYLKGNETDYVSLASLPIVYQMPKEQE
jgi:hypothetical protein